MDDDALLAAFRAHQRQRGLAPGTLECYRSVQRQFSTWLVNRGLTLTGASRYDIAAWLDQRPGLCDRSRHLYIVRLHALYVFMAEEGLRADIPTARVPRPKLPQSVPRPYSSSALRRALVGAHPRTALFICLTSHAGLRVAEIARLHREDLMLEESPPVMLVHGKGRKQRVVPIGSVVLRALQRYGVPEHGPLFPGKRHGRLSPRTVGRVVAAQQRRAQVDATAHCGRHYYASQLYDKTGGDLLVVQQMLGHASPKTTAIYAAWSPRKAAAAVDLLPDPEEPTAA